MDTNLIGICKKVVKSKPKLKSKPHPRSGKKQPYALGLKQFSDDDKVIQTLVLKLLQKRIRSSHRHRKYWFAAILIAIVITVCLLFYLSQPWLVRASLYQGITYPKASVLGVDIGNLDDGQLNIEMTKIKTEFEFKKITLVNGKDKWVFDAKKIGVTFDAKSTNQMIWKFNKMNLVDKYRLLIGAISPVVTPAILVDQNVCIKALSVIPVVQTVSKDAVIYFDQDLKVKPDQAGSEFNAISTCQELSKKVVANSFTFDISLKTISANLTKANIGSKFTQIQDIISKTVTLKSGSYQLTQTPAQLFALLDISNKGADLQFSWSSRLDDLIDSIASSVNTYNSNPALGSCQYLVSNGGSWLDKVATKKIFTDLGAASPRDYTLPMVYHTPAIGTRRPVSVGNSGTVYLTFDDGLTYGDQIMNYAACYHVKVTFFELGSRVGVDAAPLRRAIVEGHAVQSHGFEHAMYDYGQRSYDWQYNDISQSIIAITGVTGVRPTYFRPPGGNRSDNTYAAAAANGVKLILWGLSSADTAGFDSATICSNVLNGIYPGASVLMHSTKQTTAGAVPCIIEGLAVRGYNMQALR